MDTDQMEIEVQKPMEWSRVLKIKVSPERVRREKEKVVLSLRKKAKIPGFRHGKAPIHLVSQRFQDEIESETVEAIIHRTVKEALEKENLHPITRATVDNVRYKEDQSLEFEAKFDIQPKIELKRYTAFKIDGESPHVDDGEIDAFIRELREKRATFHAIDRLSAEGDLVTFDYTPLDPEKNPLEKQKVMDVKIVLGENKILPDIETALYGKKAGDEEDIMVRYPEDYHREELRGKKKGFRISIGAVEEKRIPDLDEAFVESFGESTDIPSFRGHIREEILRQKQRESDRKVEEKLIDNIIEANPFEVPPSIVNAHISGFLRNVEGFDPRTADLTKIDEQVRPIAEREVKKGFIIDFILKKEKLEPKAEEVEKEVNRLAKELGKNPDELKAAIMANPEDYNGIRQQLARKKVFNFLIHESQITTV